MGSISVFVLVCACTIAGAGHTTKNIKYADNEFLIKQKAVLEVLQHIHQDYIHPEHLSDIKDFNWEENVDNFMNHGTVQEFMTMYKHGMLWKNEIFTIMKQEHREQVIGLFNIFYYAKNWETFYKSMVWARKYINEDMFVYALTVAILHRSDMVGIVIPAPYEINPHYFFPSNVIQSAQLHKMHGFYEDNKVDETYTVMIPTNYTGWIYDLNDESKLSYFTEDIGLNSYYYNFYAVYPIWMGAHEYNLNKDHRGDEIISFSKNLMARYYLERLSNNLEVIPTFTWYSLIKVGYFPSLKYYNGQHFPVRRNNYQIYNQQNYEDIEKLEATEIHMREILQKPFLVLANGKKIDLRTHESADKVAQFIFGNTEFTGKQNHFNQNLAPSKVLLGASIKTTDNHKVIPSVLEHYESALRDPMMFQLYNRYMQIYSLWENHLPSYTSKEITMEGVKIESTEIDRLVTYFDVFESDISNAVDIQLNSEKSQDFLIKAKQWRLTHMPFSVNISVFSKKSQKAVIKMFIGSKQTKQFDLNENRDNFYFLAQWIINLEEGKNVLTRNCHEFENYAQDLTTFHNLHKSVTSSIKGEMKFPLDMTEAHSGFPWRLMLPKGKTEGMPVQFFFVIVPYLPPATSQFTGLDPIISAGIGSGDRYIDQHSLRFPLDRPIDETVWNTPNMYYHETFIYHKKLYDWRVQ